MGNPAALRNLPGISTVAELAEAAQQIEGDYLAWKQYAEPATFPARHKFHLSAYSQPNWNGFTTISGQQIAPSQSAFQFDTARWNIADQAQQQLAKLGQQRETLQRQRDTVLQELQGAADQSAVQKYYVALDGINAALAEIGARESAINNQATLKSQQVNAAQQISQTAQAERQKATELSNSDQDFQTFGKLKGAFSPHHFGQ
jgi:hypothetical protein